MGLSQSAESNILNNDQIDESDDVLEVGSIFWDYEHRLVTVTADTEDQIDQLERYVRTEIPLRFTVEA